MKCISENGEGDHPLRAEGGKYDVIIVGAGPSGVFAASELCKHDGARVMIIEKGPDITRRRCPAKSGGDCLRCDPCYLVNGFGGAGAFSDGKLTLSPEFGGSLAEYTGLPLLRELIDYIESMYLSWGEETVLYGTDLAAIEELQRGAAAVGLKLIPARIRHLGTENCFKILTRMYHQLRQKVEIRTREEVTEILTENGAVTGVKTGEGVCYKADYIICGPGRTGSEWFSEEIRRMGLEGTNNPVDIGVRVEVPSDVMEHITSKIYESKLVYFSPSSDDRVRTFCMNPYGEVVTENNNGILTVNGHSYAAARTKNTNFALLVSKMFTEPFNEPLRYGKNIASLANMLGDGVIIQRLGDLLAGRRSTVERIERGLVNPTLDRATPGDLSLVLPYRLLLSILEMLKALDRIAPGVNSSDTLLYGVEVKFYSFRLDLNPQLETGIKNLFAVGDGAGVTRGLIQASASGVVAAREIERRILKAS
ncbi:MAG: NAD(P)/FAD-dependent oxidoreductase [Firmicutes bacterium]|jgi:uncharacterized FAD-dependent dehydrogenase|nr:NAD(P)/FAD-dependent oxidoreductase [Bacillota bacterium]